MTQRIRINTDHVRQVGREFLSASQQSQDLSNRLQSTVNGLQPEWEGYTQQRFYQDFQQWQTSMRHYASMLDGIGKELQAIADRFEALDRTT